MTVETSLWCNTTWIQSQFYSHTLPPSEPMAWLPHYKDKGMRISGGYSRRNENDSIAETTAMAAATMATTAKTPIDMEVATTTTAMAMATTTITMGTTTTEVVKIKVAKAGSNMTANVKMATTMGAVRQVI